MSSTLTTPLKAPAYGAVALALLANSASQTVQIDFSPTADATSLQAEGGSLDNVATIVRFIGRSNAAKVPVYGASTLDSVRIDEWVDFSGALATGDFSRIQQSLATLEKHLALRTFLVGYGLTAADLAVWGALRSTPVVAKQMKEKSLSQSLTRWLDLVGASPVCQEVLALVQSSSTAANKAKKDQGSFEVNLIGAEMGKVVTRFPPEPSGYLHIGHAKAVLLNQHFAQHYQGKLIIRFDDTNPSKEKEEFEQSIIEDLRLLEVKGDVLSHTSDYFPQIMKYAEQLIKQGDGYVDDTDQETMRQQRFDGVASKSRSLSVEENMRRWEEMKKGTEFGLSCCLRAKMSVDDKNKALRDPVMYRTNLTPHHKTGPKYKVYPTYDFACPIVDSIEGVTHALRTNEYRDRIPQYNWVLEKLKLRKVHVWEYSRMNFVYTLLSKRKLQWFVDEKLVSGWDDPRFPTVRGIRRRGMTVEALKQYILMQGASTSAMLLEWDKLWALNKRLIDPVAPRHVALDSAQLVPAVIAAPDDKDLAKVQFRSMARHKKNPELGDKKTAFFKNLWLDRADVDTMEAGEEITMMDWGNMFVHKLHRGKDGKQVDRVELKLHLDGDVKKTKKKLTWLADATAVQQTADVLVDCLLLDYDYLITKKKLEEEDDVKSVVTPVTEFKVKAVGDANLRSLKKGDIIQLERRGYYICDQAYSKAKPTVQLIAIPDGKAATTSSKHVASPSPAPAESATAASPKASPSKKSAAPAQEKGVQKATKGPTAAAGKEKAAHLYEGMYAVTSVYKDGLPNVDASKVSKMYAMSSVYGSDGF